MNDIKRRKQKEEKHFCEVLNRLCKGKCTVNDNKLFESRLVSRCSAEYKQNVRHIYPFAAVQKHNKHIFHQVQSFKISIPANDKVCGNLKLSECAKCQALLISRENYYEISGLLHTLDTAVDCVYIILCNLSTNDGLINGAICTIKHIDFNNSVNDNIPSIIWVLFEDMEVGQLHRYHNKHYMYGNISHTWTPIYLCIVCW